MLSEISQRERNIVWYHLYVESKNYDKRVKVTKKKHTYRYREQTSGYQQGKERVGGKRGVRD